MAPRPRQPGFTLVELALVVLILSIVAVAALPDAAPGRAERLARAASEVADALRFARDESLRTGAVHGVQVDTAAQRITVFRADLTTVPLGQAAVLYRPVARQPYQFVLGGLPDLAGAVIANTTGPFLYTDLARRTTVVFDARGAPTWIDTATGARAPLTDGVVQVDYAGLSATVVLGPETGRVTVQ